MSHAECLRKVKCRKCPFPLVVHFALTCTGILWLAAHQAGAAIALLPEADRFTQQDADVLLQRAQQNSNQQMSADTARWAATAPLASQADTFHHQRRLAAGTTDSSTGSGASRSGSTPGSGSSPYRFNGKFYIYEHSVFDVFTSGLRNCTCKVGSWDKPLFTPCEGVWLQEVPETAQNVVEIFMLELLKRHPGRTRDPKQATLFYIPMMPVVSHWAGNCSGTTHASRMSAAFTWLHSSPWFLRFAGADHFMTSSIWENYLMLGDQAQMMSTRGMLAMFEKPFERNMAKWRCPEKILTTPYVPNHNIQPRPYSEAAWRAKTHDFFFSGSDRQSRPERRNIYELARQVSNNSVIEVHAGSSFQMEPAEYAASISGTRFCPSPEGDTPTSRRLFDAISAGCIPVLQGSGVLAHSMWPFLRYVKYEDFAILVSEETFRNTTRLVAWGKALLQDVKDNERKYINKYKALIEVARPALLFGSASPYDLDSAAFTSLVADNTLRQAARLFHTAPFSCCSEEPLPSCCMQDDAWGWHIGYYPCGARFPMSQSKRDALHHFLRSPSEQQRWPQFMLSLPHQLLTCTVPLSGGRLVRQLLQTSVVGDHADSGPALRSGATSVELQTILPSVHWIKTVVIRNPVTRMLAAYLYQYSQNSTSIDSIQASSSSSHGSIASRIIGSPLSINAEIRLLYLDSYCRDERLVDSNGAATAAVKQGFGEFVEALAARSKEQGKLWDMPGHIKPQVAFCGLRHPNGIQYDSVMRWEDLSSVLPRVLTSLKVWKCPSSHRLTGCTPTADVSDKLVTELGHLTARYEDSHVGTTEMGVVAAFYSQKLLEQVALMYGEDMQRFGYTLEQYAGIP